MTSAVRKRLGTLGIVLVLVLLTGLVMNLYGVFDEKESNPKNLIGIAAVEEAYLEEDSYNTGYGVTVTVKDTGAVKVSGTATADVIFELIPEGIKLEAGETYTLSAGVKSATYNGYHVRLHNITTTTDADKYIYADLDGTFTAPNSTDTYVLEVFIGEDTRVNATFYPVLVEGDDAGEFYAE